VTLDEKYLPALRVMLTSLFMNNPVKKWKYGYFTVPSWKLKAIAFGSFVRITTLCGILAVLYLSFNYSNNYIMVILLLSACWFLLKYKCCRISGK